MGLFRKAALACVTVSILAVSVCPALAQEAILKWHSEIEIHDDASMTVTETIRVRAEGNQIKRGIYRDFPTTYKDRVGNRVTVDFTLLGVERDSQPEPHQTKDAINGIRIYAGQRNVFLQPGVYTYQITYRTDRQLGYFDEHDELYWNVTGNGWEFPIEEATAAITLPAAIPSRTLRMEGYTGVQGSREQNVNWDVNGQGQVVFASGRALLAGEGLTIVLGWPKGHVTEPSRRQKADQFISANKDTVLLMAGIVALFIYYIWAWLRAGKDPAEGTVIPLFEPPNNLSPAATRYITEMGFDHRAFAAAVINLAVKGAISITDEPIIFGFKREYTLHKKHGEPGAPLCRGENKILKKLFPGGSDTLILENENHKRVSGAIKALKEVLNDEHQKTAFVDNSKYVGFGFLISIAIIGMLAVGAPTKSGGPPLLFILLWFVPWTGATLFLWISRKFIMAAIFTFFLVSVGSAFAKAASGALILSIVFLMTLNVIFHGLLKAPTRLGRKVMDRIEGFKMYLSTAEEHRLEKLHPPDKTPELFEKYLPYALALEVDQQWSEKFAGVLYRASSNDDYSPGWYHGRNWDSLNPGSFASDLGSSLSSAVSSASTAPGSSSGFGGGGSSGGGGGGGGGGGW